MSRRKRRSTGESGRISRRAALGLIGGGGLLTVGMSGAFDVVRVNRPFDLPVRSDDEASLGIDLFEPRGTDGTSVTLLELQNGYGTAFETVSVTVVSTGAIDVDVDNSQLAGPFEPGQDLPVVATISCSDDRTESIALDIVVSSDRGRIEARRTVDVTCLGAAPGPISACSLESTGSESPIDLGGAESRDAIVGEYDVTLSGNATVHGDVDVTGSVEVANGASIGGDLTAGGSITLSGGITIGGNVTTGESLTLTNGAKLEGDALTIDVCGDLALGGGPDVVAESISVGGTLSNDGEPGVGRGFEVGSGGLYVGGDLDIRGGSSVTSAGDVVVDGSVFWDGNALETTAGDLLVGGDLEVTGGRIVDVEGEIDVDGTLTMGGTRLESRSGDVRIGAGAIVERGTIRVHAPNSIVVAEALTMAGGDATTHGDVSVGRDLVHEAGSMIETGDTVTVAGTLEMGQDPGGWPTIEADVVVYGSVNKDRGTISGDIRSPE